MPSHRCSPNLLVNVIVPFGCVKSKVSKMKTSMYKRELKFAKGLLKSSFQAHAICRNSRYSVCLLANVTEVRTNNLSEIELVQSESENDVNSFLLTELPRDSINPTSWLQLSCAAPDGFD